MRNAPTGGDEPAEEGAPGTLAHASEQRVPLGRMQRVHAHERRVRRGVAGQSARTPQKGSPDPSRETRIASAAGRFDRRRPAAHGAHAHALVACVGVRRSRSLGSLFRGSRPSAACRSRGISTRFTVALASSLKRVAPASTDGTSLPKPSTRFSRPSTFVFSLRGAPRASP